MLIEFLGGLARCHVICIVIVKTIIHVARLTDVRCTRERTARFMHAAFNTEFLSCCHHMWLTAQSDTWKLCGRRSIALSRFTSPTQPVSWCICTGCSRAFRMDETLRLRALLNTEQRCVQGCSKLHETGCMTVAATPACHTALPARSALSGLYRPHIITWIVCQSPEDHSHAKGANSMQRFRLGDGGQPGMPGVPRTDVV